MKKTLTFIVALVLIISTLGCNKNSNLKNGEDVLVSFSDKSLNITTNDLYDVLKEKYGINFLMELIDEKVLNKEYETDSQTEDFAKVQLDSIKNYYETEAEFLKYINSYGYQTEEELKDYFKLNYKRNLAVYDYLESLLSEDEIKSYYENNITGDVTGSHILIEVNETSTMTEDEKRTAKEDALNKAKEVIKKLNDGSKFEDLAKEYSTDDATKNNGGNMGTFNPLDLDNVTRQEFNKLEVNKYSTEPVETEYGYEIFLKLSEKEKPSLDKVRTKIIKTLSDEKITQDNKLQYKGLEAIREKYGFSINDEDLEVYYENTMNNLLSDNTSN